MNLQPKYSKFHENIKLTRESEQYREAREKDDLITPKVENAFRDKGYSVRPNFLQGSMATDLGVIPLDGDYDIDRAVVIGDNDKAPENPIEVKKVVRDVLSNHGFSEPRIKKPCITGDYKNKDLHIDYPVYKLDDDGDYFLAVGKEFSNEDERKWDISDPKGLINWIKSDDNLSHPYGEQLTTEERAQFRRIVKYLKRWRDFTYSNNSDRKKVYSIGLTVMCKEQFHASIDEDGNENDHDALIMTLQNMLEAEVYFKSVELDKYDIVVKLPVEPGTDIFNKHKTTVGTKLRNQFQKLLNSLQAVSDEVSMKKACDKLRALFGDDFPEGDDDSAKNYSTTSAPGIVGVSNGA